ncbi:MAG: M20/M25/M40 family metallo-hydrolase [Bacteroidetes bacterium]|jgi:endoglucanase|nr:M20/M25/M40 family metallo-hydrolase [Bacteroidota bacterium]
MIDIELLAAICRTPGAPGYEHKIRSFIIGQLKDLADEVTVDSMGNVVAKKHGSQDKTLAVAAHMDEISFVVTHIDDDGFVRFQPLGGFDPKTLTAQRVIIHGREDVMGVMGSKPIHIMKPEDRKKPPRMEDYFIDTGCDKETLLEKIAVGDTITRERELIEMGPCVNAKSLDNRVSVFILLEAFRLLKDVDIPVHLQGVFTVQEEVGVRGAQVAAHHLNPDFTIALDTTIAFDTPGAQPHEKVTQLGSGTAIKILDGMTICDYRMVDFMKQQAAQHQIPWQAEVLPAGGTDTAAMQRSGKNGSIAGAISIPTRHIHQVIEMVHQADVKHSIDLLIHCIRSIDQYDWSHK